MMEEHIFFDRFLFIYQFDIGRDLSKINEYYDRVENFFDEEKDRIEKDFEARAEKIRLLDLQDKQELIENFGWELSSSQSDFPSLLRSSAIITIFNLCEHYLSKICNHFESSKISKIKLQDINGRGIERSKIYLTKVVEIDFAPLNSQWNFIKKLNLVRNIIVHNGTILPLEKDHKVNKFVESRHDLTGSPGKELIVHKGFIHYTIDELIKFFHKLFRVIFEKSPLQ